MRLIAPSDPGQITIAGAPFASAGMKPGGIISQVPMLSISTAMIKERVVWAIR